MNTEDMDPITAAALAVITVNNINDVRGNLTLPTTSNGLPVTWSSEEPSIISADGIVNRPANESVIALTATALRATGFPGLL